MSVNGVLDSNILNSLYEISDIESISQKYVCTELYNNAIRVTECKSKNLDRVRNKIIKYINEKKYNDIIISLSHQDFTSWNIKRYREKTYIFDWEFSKKSIVYFDIIHFVYFEYILVEKMKEDLIIEKILYDKYIKEFKYKLNISESISDMFIFYLIELIYNYLEMNEFNLKSINENYIINNSINILEKLL